MRTRVQPDWGDLTVPLQVKETEEVAAAVHAAARKDGRSISDLLRRIIREAPQVAAELAGATS